MVDPKKLNTSGCYDLTAYEAIEKVSKEEKEAERHKKFMTAIFTLCELAGYHLEERIVVKDVKTGKIWR